MYMYMYMFIYININKPSDSLLSDKGRVHLRKISIYLPKTKSLLDVLLMVRYQLYREIIPSEVL